MARGALLRNPLQWKGFIEWREYCLLRGVRGNGAGCKNIGLARPTKGAQAPYPGQRRPLVPWCKRTPFLIGLSNGGPTAGQAVRDGNGAA